MPEASNTKRVAKNTLMLYFRQILIMIVSLYTVRIVLRQLGDEDYGIYNVVAGVVTMFSFLSGAMTTASQRYFSFDLGKNDKEHLKLTFSVTLQIYIIICIIVILFAETIGLWFVNHKLIIPPERLVAANWIFQAAVISFVFTLITTPFTASIIAHENMSVYAYVSIVEVMLKFVIVLLLKIVLFDKLIVYGIFLSFVALITSSIYFIYCRFHYEECRFAIKLNKKLFYEIISYSGWNLFGGVSSVVKVQIINILLNLHFGPIVNTARGLATQVNSAVSSFSQNFSMAIRPQIIKSYATSDFDSCNSFVYMGSRLTFYLMFVFSCPLLIELPFVLQVWLKYVPEYVVIFTRLLLIEVLIDSFSYPIMTLSQATGKIKLYQAVVGGMQIMNFPISWLVLKFNAPAYSVMIVGVVLAIIATICRLIIIKRLTVFSIINFIVKVILPCLLVVIFSMTIPLLFHIYKINKDSSVLSLINIFFTIIFELIIIYFVGLNKREREIIISKVKEKVRV